MDIIKLFTYWDADQAQTVLEFIDQLRDVIIEHYAGDIAQLNRTHQPVVKQQVDFIDDIDF